MFTFTAAPVSALVEGAAVTLAHSYCDYVVAGAPIDGDVLLYCDTCDEYTVVAVGTVAMA